MAFQRDRFIVFYRLLQTEIGGSNAEQSAVAENFLLEERLPDEREDSYGEDVVAPSDADSWNAAHDNYLAGKINLTERKLGLPETFTDINRPNFHHGLNPDTLLVRVEKISGKEKYIPYKKDATEAQLVDYLSAFVGSKKDAELASIFASFLKNWNRERDFRPCFAGLWEEVKDLFVDSAGNEMDNDNWGNELRNRFGLGHYDPQGGEPISVLLLRYRVGDVFAAVGTDAAFAAPTVLDNSLWPFFCPSPSGGKFGQIVDFSSGGAADYRLTQEILHQRIDWRPEHIYRVGRINKSPGKTCEEARRIHLEYFQDDFKQFKEVFAAAS